jgi:GH24 family phage-related lysozyme (muramidase)
VLTYNLEPGYTVTWTTGENWRLPKTGSGWDQQGSSYSEMSHLWHDELNFSDGETPSSAELNATNFDNLVSAMYWTDTQKSGDFAWLFNMGNGKYSAERWYWWKVYGVGVRRGEVSAVPLPGALYLLGSGLMCLVSFRGRKKA